MDDALPVRFVQRIRDLDGPRERLVERHRPFRQPRGERLAVDQLHDEEVDPLVVADVVDRADVRMIERGDGARLAFEAGAALRVGGEGRRQDLHGDIPSEPRVLRAVDLAHPASADGRIDPIRAELTAEERGCRADDRCLHEPRRRIGAREE